MRLLTSATGRGPRHALASLVVAASGAQAQAIPQPTGSPGIGAAATATAPAPVATRNATDLSAAKVVLGGVVPDEATHAAIVGRVRELYGADRVVDQMGIDKRVAPPNWLSHVQRVLTPALKQVTQGRLRISGNVVEINGNTASEVVHRKLIEDLVTQLDNPTYTVRDGLRVDAATPSQQTLDAALAKRTIEFELGNATLTPRGVQVLTDLLPLLKQFAGRHFEIVGHTDNAGPHDRNLQLSAARAEAVKAFLVAKGIPATDIATSGAGPDRPVADNQTAEGRARNRRIEFRVLA